MWDNNSISDSKSGFRELKHLITYFEVFYPGWRSIGLHLLLDPMHDVQLFLHIARLQTAVPLFYWGFYCGKLFKISLVIDGLLELSDTIELRIFEAVIHCRIIVNCGCNVVLSLYILCPQLLSGMVLAAQTVFSLSISFRWVLIFYFLFCIHSLIA